DDTDGMPEGFRKIKAHPAGTKIVRLAKWTLVDDWPGIAKGDAIILPVLGGLLDLLDHIGSGEFRSGRERARLFLPGGEHLDICGVDINHEDFLRLGFGRSLH